MTDYEILSQRISDLCEDYDIEQKELSEYCTGQGVKCSEATISDIVKGQKDKGYSYKIIKCIAEKFNISTDYLLGLSDVATPDTTIQAICEYTGLNEEAVNFLHHSANQGFVNGDFSPIMLFAIGETLPMKNYLKNYDDLKNVFLSCNDSFVGILSHCATCKMIADICNDICNGKLKMNNNIDSFDNLIEFEKYFSHEYDLNMFLAQKEVINFISENAKMSEDYDTVRKKIGAILLEAEQDGEANGNNSEA